MVTDEMVEAFIVASAKGNHPGNSTFEDRVRAGLIAADLAAWQPISSAPHDGTFVLLGRFVKYCEYGHAGMMVIDRYSRPEDNRGWIGWGKFSHLWPPTHWRHLPDAP